MRLHKRILLSAMALLGASGMVSQPAVGADAEYWRALGQAMTDISRHKQNSYATRLERTLEKSMASTTTRYRIDNDYTDVVMYAGAKPLALRFKFEGCTNYSACKALHAGILFPSSNYDPTFNLHRLPVENYSSKQRPADGLTLFSGNLVKFEKHYPLDSSFSDAQIRTILAEIYATIEKVQGIKLNAPAGARNAAETKSIAFARKLPEMLNRNGKVERVDSDEVKQELHSEPKSRKFLYRVQDERHSADAPSIYLIAGNDCEAESVGSQNKHSAQDIYCRSYSAHYPFGFSMPVQKLMEGFNNENGSIATGRLRLANKISDGKAAPAPYAVAELFTLRNNVESSPENFLRDLDSFLTEIQGMLQ